LQLTVGTVRLAVVVGPLIEQDDLTVEVEGVERAGRADGTVLHQVDAAVGDTGSGVALVQLGAMGPVVIGDCGLGSR
jgi:hypothetical protein